MRKRALLLFLALAAAACGYRVARRGVPHGAGPFRVAAVANDTAQAEVGGLLATELRQELMARGRLAKEGSVAPALEAELLALRSTPSATGAAGAAAFRLEADVKLRMRDPAGVQYEDVASGAEDYLAGVDVLGTEANRRAALRRLTRALSRELLERLDVRARLE